MNNEYWLYLLLLLLSIWFTLDAGSPKKKKFAPVDSTKQYFKWNAFSCYRQQLATTENGKVEVVRCEW